MYFCDSGQVGWMGDNKLEGSRFKPHLVLGRASGPIIMLLMIFGSKIEKIQGLKSDEYCCTLDNDPKLGTGKSDSR